MTTIDELRAIGKSVEDATEGFTKKGTIHEKRTFNVDGRTFLVLGKETARMKLERSLAFAKKLAAKEPDVYVLSGGGWIDVTLQDDGPELELLEAWIYESYALIAGVPAKTKATKKPKKKRGK